MNRILTTFGICAALSMTLMGNSCDAPIDNRLSQAQKASEAAKSIAFTDNAEIENIKKRIELTSKPGLLGYVAIINKVGQVSLYTPVQGKLTSGSKRLNPPDRASANFGGGQNTVVRAAPSDEGTGEVQENIFSWSPNGQYFQTNEGYIYSDKPFRPTQQPLLVIDSNSSEKN